MKAIGYNIKVRGKAIVITVKFDVIDDADLAKFEAKRIIAKIAEKNL